MGSAGSYFYRESNSATLVQTIEYSDFSKLKMRVGRVISAERIPRTEKLLKIIVDMGQKQIQIASSLVGYYTTEELVGKQIVVLTNLKPSKFSDVLSEGMLLCAEDEEKGICVLLTPEKNVPEGTPIT